jgi:midasin
LPSDYEKEAVEEGPELDAKSGMGLGEGETTSDAQDVSDRFESEDQLEDTMKAGESAKPADEDLNDDEKGVEMSEDFEGKQQDKDKRNQDEDKDNEDSGSDEEEEDLDKQMGDVEGEDKEALDDQMWGGSSDEEEEDMKDENEEKGKGVAQRSEPELAPKDSDLNQTEEKEPESNPDPESNQEKNKKEYNEMDEGEVNDDQTDPYHGENQPEEEPEALDLPDDLQLDEGEAKDDGEAPEENPFDLDTKEREDFPELDENEEGKELDEEGQKEISDHEDDGNDGAPVDIEMPNQEQEEDSAETDEKKPEGELDEPMEIDEPVEGENAEEEKAVPKETEMKPGEDQPEPSKEPQTPNAQIAAQQEQNKTEKEDVEMKNVNQEEHKTDNEQSTGQVESEEGTGQEGQANKKEKSHSSKMEQDDNATRKPGETDSERALSSEQSTKSRLKTMKQQNDKNQAEEANPEEPSQDEEKGSQNEADLYQHIKQAEKYDALTVDNATKEQVEQQQKAAVESKEESEELPKMDEAEKEKDEDKDSDLEELDEAAMEQNQPDLIRGLPQDKKKNKKSRQGTEEDAIDEKIDVEGEKVLTYGAQRPSDSVFHTQLNLLNDDEMFAPHEEDVEMIDPSLLAVATVSKEDSGSMSQWHELERKTLPLSQELCEQLRLILEPTQASRLKGDYKTGKRLNMRKVSNFT